MSDPNVMVLKTSYRYRYTRAILVRSYSHIFVLLTNIITAARVPLITVAFMGLSAAAHADDIRDIVERTLASSPDVGIVVEGRRAAAYEVNQANGLFLPSVDLRTTAGEQFTNDQTSRNSAATTGRSRTVNLPRYEAGVTLRQLLFDGDESENELALRTARRQSASRRVLQTSVGVALDAIEAYLESLRHRELVALAQDTVTAHEQTLGHVEEMAEGGAVGMADVKQAESRLARARDDFAQARNRMNDADATYRRVVGEPVANLNRPTVPLHALPPSIATAVELAVGSNAAVKVAKSEMVEAEAEYRKSRSNYFPRLNFEVSANSARNLDGVRGSEADVSALLVMNYNLYRGGSDVALRQSLIARLGESRQRLNRAVRLVEEQTRLSWNALRNGRDRVKALLSEVRANEIVRTTYRDQFDLNKRSLLDLLGSENDLFIAKANLITSEFAVMFGTYRVLATTGDLLSSLDVQPPPEAFDTGVGESVPINAREPLLPAGKISAPVMAPEKKSSIETINQTLNPVATAPVVTPQGNPRGQAVVNRRSAAKAGAAPSLSISPPRPSLASEYTRSDAAMQASSENAVPLYWGFN